MSESLPKRVTLDQFTGAGGRATHEPTGASFLQTERGVVTQDWCLAGLIPATYDPAEIRNVAQEFLALPY